MRPARTAIALALAATLAGCGVQPTGVIAGGEPATGLTGDLRIYFVRDTQLQGVSRPGTPLKELNVALKMVMEGPTKSELERGLTSVLPQEKMYASGRRDRVTVSAPGISFADDERSRLAEGQLVCTLARAQSFLEKKKLRPDDIQVTLEGEGPPLGPYRCSQFITT